MIIYNRDFAVLVYGEISVLEMIYQRKQQGMLGDVSFGGADQIAGVYVVAPPELVGHIENNLFVSNA